MRRTYGNKTRAIELVEDGIVDAYELFMSCLMCMSEDEVGDMLHCEGYLDNDDDDADDDDDDDADDDADDDDADDDDADDDADD